MGESEGSALYLYDTEVISEANKVGFLCIAWVFRLIWTKTWLLMHEEAWQMLSGSDFVVLEALKSKVLAKHFFLLVLCLHLSLLRLHRCCCFASFLPIFISLLRQFQLRNSAKGQQNLLASFGSLSNFWRKGLMHHQRDSKSSKSLLRKVN